MGRNASVRSVKNLFKVLVERDGESVLFFDMLGDVTETHFGGALGA